MVVYHPSDYLEAYAAGHTSEAVSLVVATHLAMCPACRAEVDRLEALGGALLSDEPSCGVSDDALSSVMAKLGAQETASAPDQNVMKAVARGEIVLPQPLRDYLKVTSLADTRSLTWSRLPGYAEMKIDTGAGGDKAKMLKIASGARMPRHTHHGVELTLVLQGGYSDHSGHYGVGDLAVADPSIDHAPVADIGEDCVCLAVTDAGLRLTGPIGRLINPFVSL